MFGSRLEAELAAAGHTVGLGLTVPRECDAVLADLTHDSAQRIAALAHVRLPVLAFYSHVEANVRAAAQDAGFALVVPRSRLAREASALVERLLATAR
jgi:hypothetical protein